MSYIPPALSKPSGSTSQAAITAATATLEAQALPPLSRISVNDETIAKVSVPVKRITTEADCAQWIQSDAYAIYILFVQRICEACVGKSTRRSMVSGNESVDKLISLLNTLNTWTDEIEPISGPQRFGNLAFREWGATLEARADDLHRTLLPSTLHAFIPELRSYFLEAFGNFTRIDYGSGHEFAFFAWLAFLYRLSFFDRGSTEAIQPPSEAEEAIGLQIFPLYLHVVWRLQDRYGLEPAGSHGVWGLDDFHFLPYVIGAAQLRGQSSLRPREMVALCSNTSAVASSASKRPEAQLFTNLLSLPDTSLYGQSTEVVTPNLYLSSLLRIATLKRGPFHEHSPLLHDISTSVPNWIKVYTGMIKMYQAECLNKRVVVQLFCFGGVGWVWDDTVAAVPAEVHTAPRGAGLALGGAKGNLGSMGVPTTRVMQQNNVSMPPPTFTRATPRPSAASMPPPSTGAPWATKR